jgi:hypothetical protein
MVHLTKPLSSYVMDIRHRFKFFQDWIHYNALNNFWLRGFLFIQSFLTGVLQNLARSYNPHLLNNFRSTGYFISPHPPDAPQTIDENVDLNLMIALMSSDSTSKDATGTTRPCHTTNRILRYPIPITPHRCS